jgi:hypothetical protein
MTDNSAPGNIFSATAKLKLSQVAAETRGVLQQLLEQMPTFGPDARSSILYDFHDVPPLDPRACPGFQYPKSRSASDRSLGARIIVFNQVSYL